MGLIASLFSAGPPPLSDFWYEPVGPPSAAGVRVTPETALKVSAFWACVSLISDTLATMPLNIYRRLEGGAREKAMDHPLYRLLHDRPNRYQTSIEFRSMLTAHALVRGNGYARKVYQGGEVVELVPLDPVRVQVEVLADGSPRYRLKGAGDDVVLTADDVFHLRGLSLDGIVGVSIVEYARQTVGLALATEEFGSRFFGNGSRPGGILTHPGKLTEDAKKRLKAQVEANHRGVQNAHGLLVLEEDMKFTPLTMPADDAQLIETREFQVIDIARWFRVPLHLIGETTKSTSWGTGIESLSIGFVTYTLLPWTTRWDQALERGLEVDDGHFVEHDVNGLLRGDVKSRYEAYGLARQWGWFSVNDIRRRENENPIENGDIYLQAMNMVEAGTVPEPAPAPVPVAPEPSPAARTALLEMFATDAANRCVRREIAAVTKLATKHASDPSAWTAAVGEFYDEHAEYVVAALRCPIEDATQYVAQQQAALARFGVGATADWEATRVVDLVTLALRGRQ